VVIAARRELFDRGPHEAPTLVRSSLVRGQPAVATA